MNRDGKKTTVVQVKVAKNYEYQDLIFHDCIGCLENDNIPEVEVGILLFFVCSFF